MQKFQFFRFYEMEKPLDSKTEKEKCGLWNEDKKIAAKACCTFGFFFYSNVVPLLFCHRSRFPSIKLIENYKFMRYNFLCRVFIDCIASVAFGLGFNILSLSSSHSFSPFSLILFPVSERMHIYQLVLS